MHECVFWNLHCIMVSKFRRISYNSLGNKSRKPFGFHFMYWVYFWLFSWLGDYKELHITSSDLTLKLLICCDRREWISVENHFFIKPCLLRRWICTNALLEICPQFLPELPWSYCSWWYPPRSPRKKVAVQIPLYVFELPWHALNICFS